VEVLDLNKNINKLAKIYVVVFTILILFNLRVFQGLFFGALPSVEELLYTSLGILIPTVASAVEIAVVYLALKALAKILRILMEMEFNSRGAKSN